MFSSSSQSLSYSMKCAWETETTADGLEENMSNVDPSHFSQEWTVCSTCQGEGKSVRPPSRKARLRHKRARMQQQQHGDESGQPTARTADETVQPPRRVKVCTDCLGAGIIAATSFTNMTSPPPPDNSLPSPTNGPMVGIVGGGLAGLALAAACRHRGIPHAVFERDTHFGQRSQGYGLTLQQAAKALKSLGLPEDLSSVVDAITSTKHVVHREDGTVVGQWGLRQWCPRKLKNSSNHDVSDTQLLDLDPTTGSSTSSKRQNVHIARQALRYLLLQAAGGPEKVHWNHRFISYRDAYNAATVGQVGGHAGGDDDADGDKKSITNKGMVLTFQVGQETVEYCADLIVGADGIRSAVRRQLISEEVAPLRYLGCLVVLGICRLDPVVSGGNDVLGASALALLDGETVFQTADGTTRIYMMPYSKLEYMWQLSFPMDEGMAKDLSRQGANALKEEAVRRCQSWHSPIPEILRATHTDLVSGYPVYDRALLTRDLLESQYKTAEQDSVQCRRRMVTLTGDAAHPMSPFKGQGANQALLDALSLARAIYAQVVSPLDSSEVGDPAPRWRKALDHYETDMLERSSVKVRASASAAEFLHTSVAIQEGNVTRGGAAAKVKFTS